MEKPPVKIYSDKKHAILLHIVLFLFSSAFLIYEPFTEDSFLEKLFIILAAILFLSISIFGFFTLLSKRFQYFGPDTEEYKNQPQLNEPYLISKDKIQKRINLDKVIFYRDVISIVAIPNDLNNDEDYYDYFIEIKDNTGKKMVLKDWDGDASCFLKLFHENKNVSVKKPPTFDEYRQKYGTIRRFFTSLLFSMSPVRIVLWTSDYLNSHS